MKITPKLIENLFIHSERHCGKGLIYCSTCGLCYLREKADLHHIIMHLCKDKHYSQNQLSTTVLISEIPADCDIK